VIRKISPAKRTDTADPDSIRTCETEVILPETSAKVHEAVSAGDEDKRLLKKRSGKRALKFN